MILHRSCLELAKATFESPGTWDDQWSRFGDPAIRFPVRVASEHRENSRGTLYFLDTDMELNDWGKLRQFEKSSTGQKIKQLAAKTVPGQLQRQIFQDSLRHAAKSGEEYPLSHQKMVGDCYSVGFGVEQNISEALSWYERAAQAGSVDATETFLRIAEPESADEHLGAPVYCQWLCRVLLSAFDQGNYESMKRSKYSRQLLSLEHLLCSMPELARVALEEAFANFVAMKDPTLRKVFDDTTVPIVASTEWAQAVNAIRKDDQEALRQAISNLPTILKGRPDESRTLAYVAAESGRAGLLRMLIEEYGVDCQLPNNDGVTPLACAVRLGNTAVVRVLMFSDRNVKLVGDIAAMDTAAEGDSDLTKLLFEKFAGPQSHLESENRPNGVSGLFGRWSFFSLASAILNNSWTVFCTLLAIGVNPDTISLPEISGAETFFAGTLLASTSYNPIMLATLLAFGASVNMRVPAPDNRTALHLACGKYFTTRSGWQTNEARQDFTQHWSLKRTNVPQSALKHLQKFMIWILLIYDANVEAPDNDGLTPLAYSLQHSADLTAATYLLEQRSPADIDAPDFSGNTPLHRALENNDLERLEFILRHRASVDAQNFMGETPLCKAVKQGDVAMCKRLLHAGANIRATDANGQNCFHLALWHSKMDILQLFEGVLLAHSQNALEQTLLDRDCRGWSSIHTCILKSGTDPTFVSLFERWISSIRGLDLDAQDGLGWTMLHMASSNSYDCARILLEHGASANVKDTILGWTPLHHACNEGIQEVWNLLLDYGADFFLRDDLMGWTPMTVLEQAMDCLRLESGETWVDEEGNPVGDDDDDEEWQDEVNETEEEQPETQPRDPVIREELARRRAKLRSRVTRFFTEESMRRITRPVRQADIDREIDLARASMFPEHRYLEMASLEADETLRMWNSRNSQRACFVDRQGQIRRRVPISPAACSTLQPYRVWAIDLDGTIRGLAGVE